MSMLLTEPNPSKGLWEGEIANYLLVGAAGGRGIIHHLRLIT